MKPMVKICGLMRAEDVVMCCDMGVDICGFVTEYPLAVPWNLTRHACQPLIQAAAAPAKSCIVTGGSKEKIIDLALTLRPDYVQLHYRETPEDAASIVRELSPYGIGVIKTIPNSSEERLEQFGTDEPESCAERLWDAGVSIILVDSRGPSNAASAGTAADLSLYRRVKASAVRQAACQVMLGGGIRPDNCRKIIEAAHPDMIDVMTGVETAPGIKSSALLKELLDQIKCKTEK